MTSKDVDNNPIVVSISCITYNHAPYIRQCLEGFMMQQTNFAFEVLIHDDASTDGTTEIIKEYEARYPDVIKPIYEEENQWVKGRRGSAVFNFPRARGKYIALCEGDDYWTDPLKLQKQVDFLESNITYALCCHRFKTLIGRNAEDTFNYLQDISHFDLNYFIDSDKWLVQTLTLMFRSSMFNVDEYNSYSDSKDVTLIYYLLKHGDGYLLQDDMGVYRIHDSGCFSSISWSEKLISTLRTLLGISLIEGDKQSAVLLKRHFETTMQNIGRISVLKEFKLFFLTWRQLRPHWGTVYFIKKVLHV